MNYLLDVENKIIELSLNRIGKYRALISRVLNILLSVKEYCRISDIDKLIQILNNIDSDLDLLVKFLKKEITCPGSYSLRYGSFPVLSLFDERDDVENLCELDEGDYLKNYVEYFMYICEDIVHILRSSISRYKHCLNKYSVKPIEKKTLGLYKKVWLLLNSIEEVLDIVEDIVHMKIDRYLPAVYVSGDLDIALVTDDSDNAGLVLYILDSSEVKKKYGDVGERDIEEYYEYKARYLNMETRFVLAETFLYIIDKHVDELMCLLNNLSRMVLNQF